MAMEKITENGVAIALVTGTCALTDEQTALDLIMEARYTLGAERIAIEKAAVSPDFFILSTGLAGAVLQKFINYGAKLAVYGDYSGYTSKPLRDFIRESNRAAAADAFRHAVPAPRPQPYRLAKPGLEQVQKTRRTPKECGGLFSI